LHNRGNAVTSKLFTRHDLPNSVLKLDDKVPTLHIDVSAVILDREK